jgi:hypothetical protein
VTIHSQTSFKDTISWAIFLACSWTWCIGMFLPVLLVRDYGIGGWIVFAVPNVIGAAAMGWVIRSGAASAQVVEKHRMTCITFSLATIAFQFFFAGWMFTIPVAVLLVGSLAAVQLTLAMDRRVGVLIWIASAIAFGVLIASGEAFAPHDLPIELPRQPAIDLLWLAPVCVFGFLLCPYLDLTFHRARQAIGESAERRAMSDEANSHSSLIAHRSALSSRLAFSLGFGVFFLVMILFTLAYAGLLAGVAGDIPVNGPELALQAVAAHMVLQLIFTIGVHAREVATAQQVGMKWPLLIGAAAVGLGLSMGRYSDFSMGPLLLPELIYRGFMGFYGLIFPAYVWLCLIPSASPSRARGVFVIAVLLALPMFWLGFMQQQMIWILPGMALVLASRLLVGMPRRNIV